MILCEILRLLQPRSWGGRFMSGDDIIAIYYEGQKAREVLESWGLEDMGDYNIFS